MDKLQTAILEIGHEEIPRGSNWGEHVKKYLHSVGIDFPASWCMAFVYWCVENSDCKLPDITGGMSNPLVKTGGVMKQWNSIDIHCLSHFKPAPQVKFSTPKQGDIFIMDYGKGLGHTGFVESIDKDGVHIHTIEGNTNDEGSREGFEVCRKTRKISACKGFIRLPIINQQK